MKPTISQNIRVRHPNHFEVGSYSIIDDFCYFSTRVKIGVGTHIASGCSVAGGSKHAFQIGDFSSLSSGVKIWCASNDFSTSLVAIFPEGLEGEGAGMIVGDVVFGDYTGVGANSVVMPDNQIPEGTVIGALSYVPPGFKFEPWSVYAGIPVRKVGIRDRENVLKQAEWIRSFWLRNEDG